jgi:hypothetical protein
MLMTALFVTTCHQPALMYVISVARCLAPFTRLHGPTLQLTNSALR